MIKVKKTFFWTERKAFSDKKLIKMRNFITDFPNLLSYYFIYF